MKKTKVVWNGREWISVKVAEAVEQTNNDKTEDCKVFKRESRGKPALLTGRAGECQSRRA